MNIMHSFIFGYFGIFFSGAVVVTNILMLQGRLEGEGQLWKIILAVVLSLVFWLLGLLDDD